MQCRKKKIAKLRLVSIAALTVFQTFVPSSFVVSFLFFFCFSSYANPSLIVESWNSKLSLRSANSLVETLRGYVPVWDWHRLSCNCFLPDRRLIGNLIGDFRDGWSIDFRFSSNLRFIGLVVTYLAIAIY